MKVSDFIFRYPTTSFPKFDGICRIRIFTNADSIITLITDLGSKNTSTSVDTSMELIISTLFEKGIILKKPILIDHDEPGHFNYGHTFHKVLFDKAENPVWTEITMSKAAEICGCKLSEFKDLTLKNKRLISEVEKLRTEINPHIDLSSQKNSDFVCRMMDIEDNKISKRSIDFLVQANSKEHELQKMLKSDLSIFAELYASPPEDYICFSEFPIDNGFVDFAIFTGVSRMNVILVEIKGAEFYLYNKGCYDKFNEKINDATNQITTRLGYIHRNIDKFCTHVHQIREKVESGYKIYNSFQGPNRTLKVSKDKDVTIRCVIIGGRTRDDLEESHKRHDYETMHKINIESWDTWLNKIRRK